MKKKTPHSGGASNGAVLFNDPLYTPTENAPQEPCKKDLGKMVSMLLAFYQGQKLHRFIAERLGDHCLPSTVSTFANGYGMKFHRRMVKVPNRFGSITSVMLYWLADESRDAARRYLEARGALSGQGQ